MNVTKWDPNQPRDEQGRFGEGGGGNSSGGKNKGGGSKSAGALKEDAHYASRIAQGYSSRTDPRVERENGTTNDPSEHVKAAAAHKEAAAAHRAAHEAGAGDPHKTHAEHHEKKAKEHETIARMRGGDGGRNDGGKDKAPSDKPVDRASGKVGADRYTSADMARNGGIALARDQPNKTPEEHELDAKLSSDKLVASAHMEAARIKRGGGSAVVHEKANQALKLSREAKDVKSHKQAAEAHRAVAAAYEKLGPAFDGFVRTHDAKTKQHERAAGLDDADDGDVSHALQSSRDTRTREQAREEASVSRALRTKKAFVPSLDFHYAGPQSPRILFVLCDDATPTPVERVRGEALVGDDALRFEKRYLAPLGMKRNDVGVAWIAKNKLGADLVEAISELQPEGVVVLGDASALSQNDNDALVGFLSLPRFARARDVYKASHEEEIQRKLKALRKNIDARAALLRPSVRPLPKAARPQDGAGIENASMVARLYKADAPERVVYGVVLDPYTVDLQGDWVPPREIRDTAWSFVAKHGYSSNRHVAIAEDTHVVESFVEPYPSESDEQRAMQNLPHRAYRRKFGNETIHSGAWAIAMKLSPELWAQYQRGELNAFSIEGFGTRVPMDDASSEMPQVTFVDVERA